MYAYIVRCIFEAEAPRRDFLKWLRERHVADVRAAGAIDAEIVLLDVEHATNAPAIEVRYRFESREAFGRYEREEAPRLRADGLAEAKRLGLEPNRGIAFARSTGEIID